MRVILIFTLLFVLIFTVTLVATGTFESRVLPLVRQRLAFGPAEPVEVESPSEGPRAPVSPPDRQEPVSPPGAPGAKSASRQLDEPDSLLILRAETASQRRELALQGERLAALEANVSALAGSRGPKAEGEAWQTVVRLFSVMRPAESARIIAHLPDDHAVRLIATMKPREAGQVMGLLEPERAARLSQELAGGGAVVADGERSSLDGEPLSASAGEGSP